MGCGRQQMLRPESKTQKRLKIAKKHIREGRYFSALKILRLVTENNPKNLEAYYLAGNIHLSKNEFRHVKFFFEKTLQLKPNDVKAYYGLALLSLKRLDYAGGLKYLNKALAINPNYH